MKEQQIKWIFKLNLFGILYTISSILKLYGAYQLMLDAQSSLGLILIAQYIFRFLMLIFQYDQAKEYSTPSKFIYTIFNIVKINKYQNLKQFTQQLVDFSQSTSIINLIFIIYLDCQNMYVLTSFMLERLFLISYQILIDYSKYDKNKYIILLIIESFIGNILILFTASIILSQGFLGILIFCISLFFSINFFLFELKQIQKENSFSFKYVKISIVNDKLSEKQFLNVLKLCLLGQIQIGLRDRQLNRIYTHLQKIKYLDVFQLRLIIWIFFAILYDRILQNQQYLKSFKPIIYFLFILYIPSISVIMKRYKLFNQLKNDMIININEKNNTIIKTHIDLKRLKKYEENGVGINYNLGAIGQSNLKQQFCEIFENKKQIFNIRIFNQLRNQEYINLAFKYEKQVLKLTLISFDTLKVILQSIVQSKIYEQNIQVRLFSDKNFTQHQKLIFYTDQYLSLMRFNVQENEEMYELFPVNDYYKLAQHIFIFNKYYIQFINCNPSQVIYDLYENNF